MNIHESVTSKRFKQILQLQNHTLIDLRTPQETTKGKISDDAKEIDFYSPDFETQIEKLDKNKRYLIYCRSGGRSEATMKLMKEKGFTEIYNLANGILEYNKENE